MRGRPGETGCRHVDARIDGGSGRSQDPYVISRITLVVNHKGDCLPRDNSVAWAPTARSLGSSSPHVGLTARTQNASTSIAASRFRGSPWKLFVVPKEPCRSVLSQEECSSLKSAAPTFLCDSGLTAPDCRGGCSRLLYLLASAIKDAQSRALTVTSAFPPFTLRPPRLPRPCTRRLRRTFA